MRNKGNQASCWTLARAAALIMIAAVVVVDDQI